MKIDILVPINKFNGCVTSLYDLYRNLKNYDVDCNLLLLINNGKILPFIQKYFPILNTAVAVNKNQKISGDILITSMDIFSYYDGIEENMEYQKLLVLDSAALFRFSQNSLFVDRLNNISNACYFGNKFNEKFGLKNYSLYYHKFSDRLDNIKISNDIGVLRVDSVKFMNKNIKDCNPFDYRNFMYKRWFKNECGIYFENIGKLIFEFLYLGKSVYYSNENKCLNDGLSNYLNLFCIDDNISQYLRINKDDIKKKLFFDEKDIILKCIK